jgi:hypothetical protein
MNIKDALERYLTQLKADGRSPHTAGQYRRHVGSAKAPSTSKGRRSR